MDSLIDKDLKCPRCKLRCSGIKNPSVVNTGGYNAPVDTTWSIRKSSSSNYWNKLSSISNNRNMPQDVATGAYYALVATAGVNYAQNGEFRV